MTAKERNRNNEENVGDQVMLFCLLLSRSTHVIKRCVSPNGKKRDLFAQEDVAFPNHHRTSDIVNNILHAM